MKTIMLRLSFLFLFMTLFGTLPAWSESTMTEEQSLVLLISRIQTDKIYEGQHTTECLSFSTEGDGEGFFDFTVREKHGGECPGDPLTSPLVDRFRVNRETRVIEWYEPVEDEFLPYEDVLKGKKP